jgi:hypothetical protein
MVGPYYADRRERVNQDPYEELSPVFLLLFILLKGLFGSLDIFSLLILFDELCLFVRHRG